jgi:hypothetical protein
MPIEKPESLLNALKSPCSPKIVLGPPSFEDVKLVPK